MQRIRLVHSTAAPAVFRRVRYRWVGAGGSGPPTRRSRAVGAARLAAARVRHGRGGPGGVGVWAVGAPQLLPCQASRPSLTATAAMTRAAIGLARDHPRGAFSNRPTSRRRTGSCTAIVSLEPATALAEPSSAGLALSGGQGRHDRQRQGRDDDAADRSVGLAGLGQYADSSTATYVAGQRDAPQVAGPLDGVGSFTLIRPSGYARACNAFEGGDLVGRPGSAAMGLTTVGWCISGRQSFSTVILMV